ncbi:porin [Pistricoccus aurantiacus]|uniref:porin n=1 Tax=Pistricoccus aurantiacus TaxID=1883414 RepID=UPI00363D94B5
MKKTLLVTAIAGAVAASAGTASAATIYNQDGTKLDLYGNIQLAYRNIEVAQDEFDDDGFRETDRQDDIFDNGSTVGVTGEHVIMNGLTGYFKAEWEFDADNAKGPPGGINTGDQAYLGLKGNFGDARLGSWDPLIDDWIQDPISNNEYFDNSDSSTIIGESVNNYIDAYNANNQAQITEDRIANREGDKFQYMTPSFSGLQFAIGTQYEGDNEADNALSDSSNASIFGGVKYEVGNFSIAAVYDNLENYKIDVGNQDYEVGNQYGITGQYTWNTLRVALKLERFDSDSDVQDSVNFYGIGARYGYGNGMGDLYGSYQYVDIGGADFTDTFDDALTSGDFPNEREDETANEVILGATYNVSDAMYTFLEGAFYDRENDVDNGVAVGAVYLF